jgi:diguanylate cyclase
MDANATLEQKVQNARRNSTSQYRIRKIARYDALTELYNRRAFNDYLDYLYAKFHVVNRLMRCC